MAAQIPLGRMFRGDTPAAGWNLLDNGAPTGSGAHTRNLSRPDRCQRVQRGTAHSQFDCCAVGTCPADMGNVGRLRKNSPRDNRQSPRGGTRPCPLASSDRVSPCACLRLVGNKTCCHRTEQPCLRWQGKMTLPGTRLLRLAGSRSPSHMETLLSAWSRHHRRLNSYLHPRRGGGSIQAGNIEMLHHIFVPLHLRLPLCKGAPLRMRRCNLQYADRWCFQTDLPNRAYIAQVTHCLRTYQGCMACSCHPNSSDPICMASSSRSRHDSDHRSCTCRRGT